MALSRKQRGPFRIAIRPLLHCETGPVAMRNGRCGSAGRPLRQKNRAKNRCKESREGLTVSLVREKEMLNSRYSFYVLTLIKARQAKALPFGLPLPPNGHTDTGYRSEDLSDGILIPQRLHNTVLSAPQSSPLHPGHLPVPPQLVQSTNRHTPCDMV